MVLVSGEGLGLLAWDDCTTRDDLSHDTAYGFNAESKRGNIDEKKILGFFGGLAAENTTLNCGTVCYGFIWVNASVWFLSIEEVLDELLDLWNTS